MENVNLERIDFSAVRPEILESRLLTVIGGRIRPRTVPISLRALCRMFSGTPAHVVGAAVGNLVANGKVQLLRTAGLGRARRSYGYLRAPKQTAGDVRVVREVL